MSVRIRQRLNLSLDILISGRLSQLLHADHGQISPVPAQQPARRLRQERQEAEDNGGHQKLETYGDTPPRGALHALGTVGDER